MPAIKAEDKVKTELYNATAESIAKELDGDRNFCAVVAVAVVANVDVTVAAEALEKAGRVKGEGTPTHVIDKALLDSFGLKTVEVDPRRYIESYQGIHSEVLKNVTTHHPKRFNDVWADGQTYFFYTHKHITAIVDGVNHDYTKGTAKRARRIVAVVPKNAKVSKYLQARGAA